MSEETYTCAVCGGTFAKGQTDAQAVAEYKEQFPELQDSPDLPKALVCDECHRQFMLWLAHQNRDELRELAS